MLLLGEDGAREWWVVAAVVFVGIREEMAWDKTVRMINNKEKKNCVQND